MREPTTATERRHALVSRAVRDSSTLSREEYIEWLALVTRTLETGRCPYDGALMITRRDAGPPPATRYDCGCGFSMAAPDDPRGREESDP